MIGLTERRLLQSHFCHVSNADSKSRRLRTYDLSTNHYTSEPNPINRIHKNVSARVHKLTRRIVIVTKQSKRKELTKLVNKTSIRKPSQYTLKDILNKKNKAKRREQHSFKFDYVKATKKSQT